jgi:hypothetical protein
VVGCVHANRIHAQLLQQRHVVLVCHGRQPHQLLGRDAAVAGVQEAQEGGQHVALHAVQRDAARACLAHVCGVRTADAAAWHETRGDGECV